MSTLLLIAISIAHSLRAPVFKVDYRAHQKKKDLYVAVDKEPEGGSVRSELKSLATAANSKVEAEALRFLKHEDPASTAHGVTPAPAHGLGEREAAGGAAVPGHVHDV